MLNIDRKKALQKATFKTVRAMQSVLYSAYQVHSLPIFCGLDARESLMAAVSHSCNS
jgi:hypothetical protein